MTPKVLDVEVLNSMCISVGYTKADNLGSLDTPPLGVGTLGRRECGSGADGVSTTRHDHSRAPVLSAR